MNRGNITDAIPIGQVVKGLVEALERTDCGVSGKTKGGEGEKGAAHSGCSTRNKDEQHPRPDDRPKAGTVKPVHVGGKSEEERKGHEKHDGERVVHAASRQSLSFAGTGRSSLALMPPTSAGRRSARQLLPSGGQA